MKESEGKHFTKKETPKQAFSCEFCKIFKNNFFTEHLQVTASVNLQLYKKQPQPWMISLEISQIFRTINWGNNRYLLDEH